MQDYNEVIKKVYDIAATTWIWIFGWASYYFYQISKGEKFRTQMFFINLFLASFIAYIVGTFVPIDVFYRDWIVWISAFSSHPILWYLEKRGASLWLKFIWKWTDMK